MNEVAVGRQARVGVVAYREAQLDLTVSHRDALSCPT